MADLLAYNSDVKKSIVSQGNLVFLGGSMAANPIPEADLDPSLYIACNEPLHLKCF